MDMIINSRVHMRAVEPTKVGEEAALATVFQYPAPPETDGYSGPPAGEEFVIARIIGRKEAGAAFPFSVWLVGYDNGEEANRRRCGHDNSWRSALQRAGEAVTVLSQGLGAKRIVVAAVSKEGKATIMADQKLGPDGGGGE